MTTTTSEHNDSDGQDAVARQDAVAHSGRSLSSYGSAYRRRRARFATEHGHEGWLMVDSTESRQRIRALRALGYPNKRLAALSGLSTKLCSALYQGSDTGVIFADTMVKVRDLHARLTASGPDSGPDPVYRCATEPRLVLQALIERGWSYMQIAKMSGICHSTLKEVMKRDHCLTLTAEAILALRDRIDMEAPTQYVDPGPTVELLGRTFADGFAWVQIARASGLSVTRIIQIHSGQGSPLIRRRTAEQIVTGVDKLRSAYEQPHNAISSDLARAALERAMAEGYSAMAISRSAGLSLAAIRHVRQGRPIHPSTETKIVGALEQMRAAGLRRRAHRPTAEARAALLTLAEWGYALPPLVEMSGVSRTTLAEIRRGRRTSTEASNIDAILDTFAAVCDYREHAKRRWPTDALKIAVAEYGVTRSWFEKEHNITIAGVTISTAGAERAAKALGLHPVEIWADW